MAFLYFHLIRKINYTIPFPKKDIYTLDITSPEKWFKS